jgi:hypothetical protein
MHRDGATSSTNSGDGLRRAMHAMPAADISETLQSGVRSPGTRNTHNPSLCGKFQHKQSVPVHVQHSWCSSCTTATGARAVCACLSYPEPQQHSWHSSEGVRLIPDQNTGLPEETPHCGELSNLAQPWSFTTGVFHVSQVLFRHTQDKTLQAEVFTSSVAPATLRSRPPPHRQVHSREVERLGGAAGGCSARVHLLRTLADERCLTRSSCAGQLRDAGMSSTIHHHRQYRRGR